MHESSGNFGYKSGGGSVIRIGEFSTWDACKLGNSVTTGKEKKREREREGIIYYLPVDNADNRMGTRGNKGKWVTSSIAVHAMLNLASRIGGNEGRGRGGRRGGYVYIYETTLVLFSFPSLLFPSSSSIVSFLPHLFKSESAESTG